MVGFLAPRHEQIRACQGSPFAAALQEFLGKTPQRLQAQRAGSRPSRQMTVQRLQLKPLTA